MKQTQNKIITIIGHKGHGKTAFSEKIIIHLNKPTIVADPRGQYNIDIARRLHFKSVGIFRKWIYSNYKDFIKYKLECIVNCHDDDFNELATIVSKMKKVTFLVDEVDMFFDTRADKKHQMYKLVHYGRHNEIDIVSTSRRPANISRNLTSQTDTFYISKMTEPTDTKYFKQRFGESIVPVIQNLKKFNFLEIDDEKRKIVKTTKKDIEILS